MVTTDDYMNVSRYKSLDRKRVAYLIEYGRELHKASKCILKARSAKTRASYKTQMAKADKHHARAKSLFKAENKIGRMMSKLYNKLSKDGEKYLMKGRR